MGNNLEITEIPPNSDTGIEKITNTTADTIQLDRTIESQLFFQKGFVIGEFDLSEYDLPTRKAYLVHQISNGGNKGKNYPKNREYLKIIGFTDNNEITTYGYIYFMLYTNQEGLKISSYIGSEVYKQYRNKGIGDLLMSIYLSYSYDNGFLTFESTTRQRKLNILYLMNKFGFKIKQPEPYDNGNRITLYKNNMVIDIYKDNNNRIYFRFKTKKAENLYIINNSRIIESNEYNYLTPQDEETINPEKYTNLGWVVPNENYIIPEQINNKLIAYNLNKSRFSQ